MHRRIVVNYKEHTKNGVSPLAHNSQQQLNHQLN